MKADRTIVCMSCPPDENFRYGILPSYKHNRVGKIKPELLAPIKDWMRITYETYERPTLEADDIMGILSTHPSIIPGQKIIVSEDKDLKGIPGWLLNPAKDTKPRMVSEGEADYWHLYQTLTGDTTDGYKGCPGVGPVKAEAVLGDLEDQRPMWERVVGLYVAKGLTEADALVQARVARICRHQDYNFRHRKVIPWAPKSSPKPRKQ